MSEQSSSEQNPKGKRSSPRKRITTSPPAEKRDRRPSSAGTFKGAGRPPFWNKPNDPDRGKDRPAKSESRPGSSERGGSKPGFVSRDGKPKGKFEPRGDNRKPRPFSGLDNKFEKKREGEKPGFSKRLDKGEWKNERERSRPSFPSRTEKPDGKERRPSRFGDKPDQKREGFSEGKRPPMSRESRLGKQAPSQARTSRYKKEVGAPGQPPEYNWGKMTTMMRRPARKPKEKEGTEPEKKSGDQMLRLNRYIAQAGLCSRREADELISTGQITVNGKIVDQMGYLVKADDVVKYGKRLLNREKLIYVLLNKPKDFLTTTEDPDERKTVMQLVANACKERIYPVGRLDRNTTGLLLLTNDGELSEKLMHPSNNISKIYQVDLDKPLTHADEKAIREGLTLEDGFAPVDEFEVLSKDRDIVGIKIHIGRNRIVRRIFEHLGYQVMKLDRVFYAGLTKKDLPRGNWRFLTEKEVINLKYFT